MNFATAFTPEKLQEAWEIIQRDFLRETWATVYVTVLATLFAIIIGSALCMFLGWSTYYLSSFAAAIFSLYIGYDMYRAQRYPKTADNAVDCAVDIYLDIINLFLRLLRILGRRRN